MAVLSLVRRAAVRQLYIALLRCATLCRWQLVPVQCRLRRRQRDPFCGLRQQQWGKWHAQSGGLPGPGGASSAAAL